MGEIRSRRGFGVLRQALLAAVGVAPLAGGCSDAAKPFECQRPEQNDATGLVFCETGESHRAEAKTCDGSRYDPDQGPQGTFPDAPCRKNSDCTERPWGFCTLSPPFPTPACSYGCVSDADCGAGQTCLCTGGGPSHCVEKTCEVDADCRNGALCLLLVKDNGDPCRPHQVLRCGPECTTDSDCASNQQCSMSACVSRAVCGRPFLVDGAIRLANAASRSDWRGVAAPDTRALTADVRDALAAHWTEVGLMEHASVAAFARFTLQLLAAGAPSSLVADATAAMGDETEHARLCFAIAGAYAGKDIGPGALAVDRALDDQGLANVVRTAFLEACVGETCAALEAAEAAEHATDPFVAASLRRIAADESRHAELGWRFVSWVLGTMGTTKRASLLDELHGLVAANEGASGGSSERDLESHGVLSAATRAALRRAVLAEVVSPCLTALGGTQRSAFEAPSQPEAP